MFKESLILVCILATSYAWTCDPEINVTLDIIYACSAAPWTESQTYSSTNHGCVNIGNNGARSVRSSSISYQYTHQLVALVPVTMETVLDSHVHRSLQCHFHVLGNAIKCMHCFNSTFLFHLDL